MRRDEKLSQALRRTTEQRWEEDRYLGSAGGGGGDGWNGGQDHWDGQEEEGDGLLV